jgi:hypothetical protein
MPTLLCLVLLSSLLPLPRLSAAVDVYDVVDLAAEGGSYTDIEVGCLKPSVAMQLADTAKTKETAKEVRQAAVRASGVLSCVLRPVPYELAIGSSDGRRLP